MSKINKESSGIISRIPKHMDALLEFESSHKDIFSMKFPGSDVEVWPYLRTQLWVEMSQEEFPSQVSYYTLSKKELLTQIKLIFDFSGFRFRRRLTRSEVLFVAGGSTIIIEDSKCSNWLINDLSSEINSKFIIYLNKAACAEYSESSAPNINIHRQMTVTSLIAGALARIAPQRYFKELDREVDEVGSFFQASLSERAQARVKRNLHIVTFKVRKEQKMWTQIMKQLKPKMIVVEDASYGSMSILVKLAKDLNVLVVEPQHGWIGASHGSYNYGDMFLAELGYFLPDYILTFGDYWGKNLRHPAEMISVGKPSLNRLKELRDISSDEKVVLFISSGNDVLDFVELISDIAEKLSRSSFKIKLRLHPSERSRFQDEVQRRLQSKSIELDLNTDIYTSLLQANWVVGYSSTVLYEAVALGVKPIALYSDLSIHYSDPALMIVVDDADSLISLLQFPMDESKDFTQTEVVWEEESRRKIQDFFNSHL